MYDIVKDSQVITLRQKGTHGSGSGSKQISILSPPRSQRRTFKDQMPLITQGTRTAKSALPASPDNPSTATSTSSNRQLVKTKRELQKALHVSTRDRQLTVAPVRTTVLKPPTICAT